MSLQGKIAVVSGASRGLGAGMALDLAQQGASVMLLYTSDSSASKVDALVTKITSLPHSPRAASCKADLSSLSAPDAVLSALDTWLGAEGKIDILINNAGTEINAPLGAITPESFAKVYDVNVRAPLLLTQALLPRLSTAGGAAARIINISSVGGRFGFPGMGLYCSSKAALEGLTRCWARELGGNGTTVNCVAPGPVQSDMLDNIPAELVAMQKAQTPVQNRLGTTEEVARIVTWLAGPEASWVSGQVISASGGWAMY
ncbi:3-ketoacyl-acyl carrier protein reductase [Colletotrichum truncatum]|uniref:3-ketoacyl-acyl carrier protein reductase n=1 Tax=Colletotrichum truncatum TaxID=5467 RepID=A0ACC3ZKN9_COLTU|nr:3-ketoacyl-acyl carrier protein reductase [Colletotrichum truncatum]KAF6800076.1 3-ketoacyl-acyl carrier protein reductase [Colletotrichum truncatum]